MLTLYYKPTCPYSQDVLGEAESMAVQFNLKDIASDEDLALELISEGGKRQVPFLVDTERGVKMYGSTDIVVYLQEYYKNGTQGSTFGGMKIHQGEEICDTCQ